MIKQENTDRDKLERIVLQMPFMSGAFLSNALFWIEVTPSLSLSICNEAKTYMEMTTKKYEYLTCTTIS